MITADKKPIPFHPFLIALYPILSLYSHNLGLFPSADLLRPIAIVLMGTVLVFGVLAVLLRDLARAALVTSIAIVEFFTFTYTFWALSSLFPGWTRFFVGSYLIYFWIILAVLIMALAGWKRKKGIAPITNFLNVASAILLALPLVTIIVGLVGIHKKLASIAEPVENSTGTNGPAIQPDIYYIILDGYGREDAIKKYFGYSNEPFISELKRRGFFVADNGRSNYCQTELSLASSLNMNFISSLLPTATGSDRSSLDYLLDRNAVAAFLRKRGYEYFAITSGFPAVEPKSADILMRNQNKYSLFETTLLGSTPLQESPDVVDSQYDARRENLEGALSNLQNFEPRGAKPRFVFAHVLAPHPPFVIDAKGEPIRPKHTTFGYWDASAFFAVGGTEKEYHDGYLGQLQYVNSSVLPIVDHLIKVSATPPIIILQGDHGSRMHLSQDSLAKSDVREAFRNLNAIYAPPAVRQKLYAGLTPVNSFRIILDALFGAQYKPMPDISYYTTWDHPYSYVDVTKAVEKPLPSGTVAVSSNVQLLDDLGD